MKLPAIERVGINKGKEIKGSYLDGEYVFHIIERGPWAFEVSDRIFQADELNLVLLPPHHLHAVTPVSGNAKDHWVVHFRLPMGDLSLAPLPWMVRVDRATQRECTAIFKRLESLQNTARPCAWLQASHLLRLLSLYRGATTASIPPARRQGHVWLKIEKAIGLIQEQYIHADLAIGDVSESCELSHAYFCRQFKSVVGRTPYEYLSRIRVDRAADLLMNTDYACREIAQRAGFTDPFTFTKVFRKLKGDTPLRWRKRYAGQS